MLLGLNSDSTHYSSADVKGGLKETTLVPYQVDAIVLQAVQHLLQVLEMFCV